MAKDKGKQDKGGPVTGGQAAGGQRIVAEPVDIGKEAKAPFARLPDVSKHFSIRAARLSHLAKDHPMADYLAFMAALASAQQVALDTMQPGKLPGPAEMRFFREHQLAALDRQRWPRDRAWIVALKSVIDGMLKSGSLPGPAQAAAERLARMQDEGLDNLGDRVLRDLVDPAEQAEAFFVTAALQVYWTRLAALMDSAELIPNEAIVTCPVCASAPLASIIHSEGNLSKTRFLSCSLCGTEWNYVRIKCANCQSTKGIAYQGIEGDSEAVKAETCDECKTYTKLVNREKDADVEPMADDLASLGLDVLVGEAGWTRAHPNPFILPDQAGD